MKHSSTLVLSVGILLLATAGSVQSAQEKQTLEERVQELELQAEADRDAIASLLIEMKGLQEHKAAVQTYLTAQAEQAARMESVLDESEREGFTKGINFRSREVLLAGWRAQLDTLRADVPGSEKGRDASDSRRRAQR